MGTPNEQSSASATRQLIGRDVGFLVGLLLSLATRQAEGDERATLLILTYLDWPSLVIYEIKQVLSRGVQIPGAGQGFIFADELAEARHSAKLLDDTKRTVDDQLRAFTEHASRHRDQLVGMARAPELIRRVPVLGRLQDDTSVFLCGDTIVATSLSLRYHSGLEMDADGPTVMARVEEIGAFLGSVCDEAGSRWASETLSRPWPIPAVRAMDTRFADFFSATFVGIPLAESMVLAAIACRLRASMVMANAAREAGGSMPSLAFKFRLAMVWHAVSSLGTIADSSTAFELPASRRAELHQSLASERVAPTDNRGLRGLRNVLVHYGIAPSHTGDLNWSDPLLGLPQALCDGRSWVELDALLDDASNELLELLDRWQGEFEYLVQTPR